jgi:hypothetical protein
MGSVCVLSVGAKIIDSTSQKQNGAQPECRVISLRGALEAENIRLRRQVAELLRDTSALKEALQRSNIRRRVAVRNRDGSRT